MAVVVRPGGGGGGRNNLSSNTKNIVVDIPRTPTHETTTDDNYVNGTFEFATFPSVVSGVRDIWPARAVP